MKSDFSNAPFFLVGQTGEYAPESENSISAEEAPEALITKVETLLKNLNPNVFMLDQEPQDWDAIYWFDTPFKLLYYMQDLTANLQKINPTDIGGDEDFFDYIPDIFYMLYQGLAQVQAWVQASGGVHWGFSFSDLIKEQSVAGEPGHFSMLIFMAAKIISAAKAWLLTACNADELCQAYFKGRPEEENPDTDGSFYWQLLCTLLYAEDSQTPATWLTYTDKIVPLKKDTSNAEALEKYYR